MQKVSMLSFDPFAGERAGLLTKAWKRTSRMWTKGTLMDEMEGELRRLEARMGVQGLSSRRTLPAGISRIPNFGR